jgi:hypothetical protein
MKRLGGTKETDVETKSPWPPVRWTAGTSGGEGEARAGLLLRQAIDRRPLDEAVLATIRARLPRLPVRPASRILIWQVAAGLGLMLSGGALVGAATHFLRREAPQAPPVSPQTPPTAPPRRARLHARAGAGTSTPGSVDPRLEPVLPLAPSPVPEAASDERALPSRRPGLGAPAPPRSSNAPVVVAAPEGPSSLAREARLLADVLHALRQDDDAAAALALLDRHGVGFSETGELTREARVARIEALLRLHRNDEALTLLDAMTLPPAGISREPLVARGELRARANRCAAAAADFDVLLAPGAAPDRDTVAERALYGRASCRAREEDLAGARADLNRYLARYPNGRFAAAAAAALDPAGGETPKP